MQIPKYRRKFRQIDCALHNLEKTRNSLTHETFTLLAGKIFRQINSLVISLVKVLLSHNLRQKNVRHIVSHRTVWKNEKFSTTQVFFRQINLE